MTRDAQPLGIVTDRDSAVRVVAEALDPRLTLVSDAVTCEATTAARTASVDTAVRVTSERGVRRLPIVVEDRTVTGIAGAENFRVLLAQELAQIGSVSRDNVDTRESR